MTITIVGDTDQLLYRFSGAKPELLTGEIEQWLPNIQTLKLETNYRSQDGIISQAGKLIANNYSGLGGPYPQEFVKNMAGVKGEWSPISFRMYKDANQEAAEISATISELFVSDYGPGDIFVCARTKAQLGYLEGALVRARIPFININGGSFWASRHVADVIAYLRLAHDSSDKLALERVYDIPSTNHQYTWTDKKGRFQAGDYCPTRYLGAKFLAKTGYNFDNIDRVLASKDGWRYKTNKRDYPIYGPSKAQDLQEFVKSLQVVLAQAENMGQMIQVIISDCYEKYIRANGDIGDEGLVDSKLEDLATVVDLASQYDNASDFLAYVDEMVRVAEDAKGKNWDGYVILMTIHKSKGLERSIVFSLGWCEGENTQTGQDVGLLPHTFSLVPPPNFGVLPGGSQSPLQDERCIGYVAITRAMDRVYLSGIESYRNYQMWPSRFIYEMGLDE